jgi:hypothetical protein
MGLRFSWDWQSAPEVRTAELSATWSSLMIEVDDIVATLVERRNDGHGIRKRLDLPTYPLAEWLTINWWVLNAPAHRPDQGSVDFAGAGSGFPWPDLTLRSDRSLMWAQVLQRDQDPDVVRFLTQGQTILDVEQSIGEIAEFIDATVRRLEESGIHDTLLQQEWSAIVDADNDERDFCTVAAAWGFDPYDMPDVVVEQLLAAEKSIGDTALTAELAGAIEFDAIDRAGQWVVAADRHVVVGGRAIPRLGSLVPPESRGRQQPWRDGYRRAREIRQLLGLASTEWAPIDELIKVASVIDEPPSNVDALVRVTGESAGIVVGPHTNDASRRFAGARALARKVSEPRTGLSLLTRGKGYADRVERAFAAEFLAPADGLRKILMGDYSDSAQQIAADRLGVSPSVIEHQIDNQLAA